MTEPVLPDSNPSADGSAVIEAAGEVYVPPPPPPKPRYPQQRFDRFKILLILAGVFMFLVWRQRADVPIMTFGDAVRNQIDERQWLLWLAGFESLRQIHYYASEKLPRYNHFWVERIWGAIERWKDRRDPWLRFRVARYMRWGFVYVILASIVCDVTGDTTTRRLLLVTPPTVVSAFTM